MRRNIALKATLLAVFFTAFQSCTTTESSSELAVTSEPLEPQAPGPVTPAERLAALEKATDQHNAPADDLKDIHAILVAQDFEAQGDQAAATKAWFEALTLADGAFGRKALDGWIKSYVAQLGKKTDRTVLARLLLAETSGGSISPFMRRKNLTDDKAVAALLPSLVGDYLIADSEAEEASGLTAAPPSTQGIPSDDPLLTATAAKNCAAKKLDAKAWQQWLKTLPSGVDAYWNALIQQCSGKAATALQGFHSVATKLDKARVTQALALESLGRAAALERSLSRKKDAAETYRDIIELWDSPGATPKAMGLTETVFALRRIDETLWAARYRALEGDYENGKIFAQKALDLVANVHSQKTALNNETREKLADYRAEGYHVLAYRIALEKREFESALSLNLLALQSPHLSREWIDRLTWFAGMYDYLGGNFASAKKRWEALLAQTQDDAVRAMLTFWLAKVYDRMDRKDESRFYLNALAENFPLSYYTTVAPRVAGLKGAKDWRAIFGDVHDLRRKLRDDSFSNPNVDRLRQIPEQRRLINRAEVLAAAGLNDFLQAASDDLAKAWPTEVISESNSGAFLYLTRLHLAAGDYAKAIALTTKLAKTIPSFWKKHPEQLLVYFPQPFGETYRRNALESGIDQEVLLAISRQESGFNAAIRSSANAIGVMQLIPPTGEQYARQLGITDFEPIESFLKRPEGNIRLGAHYLRFLNLHFKGFPPAIYGGYNAGEYAMDTWLDRRGHSDPLVFVELTPFGETKDYIRNVWRNLMVYRFLDGKDVTSPVAPGDLSLRQPKLERPGPGEHPLRQ